MGRRTLDLSEGNEIQAIKESVRCDSLLTSAFQEVVVLELFLVVVEGLAGSDQGCEYGF